MRQLSRMAGCVALWGMISSSAMANLIINGDFESGTNGWVIATSPAEPDGVVAVTTTNSPFSSGSSALQMTDGAVNTGQSATKDFGAKANGQYEFSFDYKLTATSTYYWIGRINNSSTAGTESFNFSIYQSTFKIGTTSVATGLSTGTWYHVSMILDSAADKVLSGSIKPFGGSATTWGEIAGLATTAEIKRIVFADNNSGYVAPSIYLDNVSLTVVPEPATIGMLGLGALITLLIRRQCMK